MNRPLKGWWTVAWNAANALVFTLDMIEATYSVPDDWQPIWLAAYIVGNFVLRFLTTTPVGRAE